MLWTIGDKTFWRCGERKVWRVLPRRLSAVVVQYLAVVVPFLEALELVQEGNGGGKNHFLFSRTITGETPKLIDERELTEAVKAASLRGIGSSITVMQWRHIAIAFGRRHLAGDLADEMATAAEEQGEEDDTIDLMAGHSTRVAEMHYAREIDDGAKFDEFINLGTRWHHLWRLSGGAGKCRLQDEEAEGGRVPWDDEQQTRLEGLDNLLNDTGFRSMCGRGDVELRDHQKRVFEAMAAGI
jgi:hypothetical protein